MGQDKELEIRKQFLDEAQEYLDALDQSVLGLAGHRVDLHRVNAALRSAHSVKGGAGMMGFQTLSNLAHRLEDSLKVVKITHSNNSGAESGGLDIAMERLLLSAVGCLRQVIDFDRTALQQGKPLEQSVDDAWFWLEANPIFEELHQHLGDPQEENAASVLSPEEGQDIVPMLFETEVEESLQRLEQILSQPEQMDVAAEVSTLAQELGGLGEMLQLQPFIELCTSVEQQLQTPIPATQVLPIAQAALQTWRQAQSVIMLGQYDRIPTQIMVLESTQTPDRPLTGSIGGSTPIVIEEPLSEPQQPEEGSTLLDIPLPDQADFPNFSTAPVLAADMGEIGDVLDWDALAAAAPEEFETYAAVDDQGYPVSGLSIPETEPIPLPNQSQVTHFKVRDLEVTKNSGPIEVPDTTVRVPVRQLNLLNDFFGELTIERNGLDLHLKRLRHLSRALNERLQTLNQANADLRTTYDKVSVSEFKPRALLGSSPPSLTTEVSRQPLLPTSVPGSSTNVPPGPTLRSTGFDSLELDRYSDLHLLSQQVMETIVQIQEVSEDISLSLDDTQQTARNLTRTSKQLQSGLTKLRMRPLSDIADRFPRALREWEVQYGKQVELRVEGGDTLIDRSILEYLNDPLMHLIRNAFDHGIESPELRQSRGKSPTGCIEIRATCQGNRTVITVQDDGEGISIDKIRTRAEQLGLDPDLIAAAANDELLPLIFESGFSTREQVTALSGRGVGMDVVRSNLKQVRGEINVNTQTGLGTTFILSVPFTSSTTRVVLAESAGMLLAFPTDVVAELFLSQAVQILQTPDGGDRVSWQNQSVELINLQQGLYFNCPCSPHGFEPLPAIAAPSILILNQDNHPFGIEVDRCWGEQEATIRRVEGHLALPIGFSNCTILGDGRVVPLVDAAELRRYISREHLLGEPPAGYAEPFTTLANSESPFSSPQRHSTETNSRPRHAIPSTTPTIPTILVVDDSINVRRFLALSLERAGYRVEQAKDGQDALERLETGITITLVICDIEMPRLDGYGFLARVKSHSKFNQIPVIILTSRSGDKHRQLAQKLGADAYFSKPYNEQILLRTIDQMVKLVPATSLS